MVTTVTSYQTSDGKRFEDAKAAEAHESMLANQAVIEAFLDRHYPKPTEGKPGPTRSIAGKAVAAWLSEAASLSEQED